MDAITGAIQCRNEVEKKFIILSNYRRNNYEDIYRRRKIIARNIDKNYKWIARDRDGNLCAYEEMPKKEEDSWFSDGYEYIYYFNHLFSAIKWEDKEPTLISDIYNPQVLDDAERRYLSAVIRPFRNKVLDIRKSRLVDVNREYISIHFIKCDFTCLPNFKRGTMYKGMEPDRGYTLEELGL